MTEGASTRVVTPSGLPRLTGSSTGRATSLPAARNDDAALAARFATADPDTIRAVYESYGRLVYSVAYKVLGDVGLAEDAAQQTFVQAWRAASTYDPDRALGAWLAAIARRVAIDVYRRERRHRDAENIDPSDARLVSLPPSVDQISDVWEVRQALDELPDQDRQLLRLQHYDELTQSEIAEQLAIPIGTVKSRSSRAHRRLAGMLGHLRTESAGPVAPAGRTEPASRTKEACCDG
jgi:RNA polymerase sigma-70 factor (ECF subfamily)